MMELTTSIREIAEYNGSPETLFQVLLGSTRNFGQNIAYIYQAGDE